MWGNEVASISKDASGNRTIQFVGKDQKRRSVRLGKCRQRQSETVKVQLERLVRASITGHPADPDLARWLTGVDGQFADKLAAVGLIRKREAATLDAFLSQHIDKQEVKGATTTKNLRLSHSTKPC